MVTIAKSFYCVSHHITDKKSNMGFANCFPKEDRKQIYIVFTDTLKKDGSVLLSLGVNKNDTSVQELSKYLDDNHTVKSVSESEQQNDIAELCQIIDGKREGTV